jgi:prefoldin subunit 5
MVTALFIISIASVALAMESMQGNVDILNGKITAIDASHQTKSLTLQSIESDKAAPNNEINIFVNDQTTVKLCDADKSLNDIKIGSNVQVTYYELAGMAVADFIYAPC